MKKTLTKLLLMLLAVTLLLSFAACNKGVAPTLANITADVMDKPVAINMEDAVVESITIDGQTVDSSKYKVEEKTFIFKNNYYGEFGIGDHTIVFNFENFDSQTITLKVTDDKPFEYELPTVAKMIEANSAFELPIVTQLKRYQKADIVYTLKDASGAEVASAGTGKDQAAISSEGVDAGAYTYEISIKKGDTVVEEKIYDITFAAKDDNPFGVWSQELWTSGEGLTKEYLSDSDSYKVTLNETYWNERKAAPEDLRYMINIDVDYLRSRYNEGKVRFNFEYKTNVLITGDYAGHGIVVYVKGADGLPINSGEGFRSIFACMGSLGNHNVLNSFTTKNNEKWQNMWIDVTAVSHYVGFDLEAIFKYESEMGYEISTIAFALAGGEGHYIEFRNGVFYTQEEVDNLPDPTPVDPEGPVKPDQGTDYSAIDYFAQVNATKWGVQAVQQGYVASVTYDESEHALKFVRGGDNTTSEVQYTSSNNRIYPTFASIEEGFAAGYKKFVFEYKSSLTDGATASGLNGFCIRKNNAAGSVDGTDGGIITIINKANGKLVTGEWTKVEVDLSAIEPNAANFYGFSIVILGAPESSILFRKGHFEKIETPDENPGDTTDYSATDFFAKDNAGLWKAQAINAGYIASFGYDEAEGGFKFVRGGDNTTAEVQFTSANNRIYIASEDFLNAYKAGYTKFTFEYKSNLTDGATASGIYGFCVRNFTSGTTINAKEVALTVSQANGNLVTGTWTKVEVDLAALFTSESIPSGLNIVVLGNANSSILFRNGHLEK